MNNLTRISTNTGIGSDFIGIFNNSCTSIESGIRSVETGISSFNSNLDDVRNTVASLNENVEILKRKYDTLIDKYEALLEKYDELSANYDDLRNGPPAQEEENTPTRGVSLSKGAPEEEKPQYESDEDPDDDWRNSGENEETADEKNGSQYDGEDENDITE